MAAVQVLWAAARAAVPWKNGGGVTREVAVHPQGAGFDTLDWRVSIAQVRTAGPFSSLPGLDRRLAVLEGVLAITLGAEPETTLSAGAPSLHFPGEAPVQAHPVDGPVTDLNIMTRRGSFTSALALHRAGHPTPLASGPASLLLVALSDLVLTTGNAEWQLTYLDGARIEAGCAFEIHPSGAEACFYVIRLHSEPQGHGMTRA
jgi:environmental stress-induced protein Ves